MNKLIYLFAFAVLTYSVSAWSVIPNYFYYTNISVNSWNGNIPFNSVSNYPINNTYWLAVNTLSNTILSNSPLSTLTISGYDQNKSFIGNINAFPNPNGAGILISRYTTNGKPYNSLTIFFGQNRTNNTYLYNFTSKNIKTQDQLINIALAIYETSGISGGLNTKFSYLLSGNSLTGSLGFYFNLSAPYFLETINNKSLNYSIKAVPYQYGTFADFYQTNSYNSILTTYGTLLNYNVQAVNNPFSKQLVYLNPLAINNRSWNYTLLTYDSGVFNNGGAFNSVVAYPQQKGVFFQPTLNGSLLSQSFQYLLTINYTAPSNTTINFPLQPLNYYYLIPAYTSNYTANVVKIPKPIPPNLIVNCTNNTYDSVSGWYYDFNNRQLINVSSWDYNLKTTAYNSVLTNINVSGANYLLLNMSYYNEMGAGCGGVYFRAYNNNTGQDFGSVTYSIVSCNYSTAKFLLSNRTSGGYTYNSVYLYLNSRTGLTGFANPTLLQNWKTTFYGTGNNVFVSNSVANSIIFSVSNALNQNDYIAVNGVFGTGWGSQNGHFGINGSSGGATQAFCLSKGAYGVFCNASLVSSNGGDNTFLYTYNYPAPLPKFIDNTCTAILVSPSFIGSGIYATATQAGGFDYINMQNNAVGLCSQNYFSGTTSMVWDNLEFKLPIGQSLNTYKLYSSAYSVGQFQYYAFPSSCGYNTTGKNIPSRLPTTNSTPISPNSVVSLKVKLANPNATLTTLGLNQTITFYGMNMPYYTLDLILLILMVAIIVISRDEILIVMGSVIIFMLGIFNVQALYLGLFIGLIFLVYKVSEMIKKRG